jgi:hypothetical protein
LLKRGFLALPSRCVRTLRGAQSRNLGLQRLALGLCAGEHALSLADAWRPRGLLLLELLAQLPPNALRRGLGCAPLLREPRAQLCSLHVVPPHGELQLLVKVRLHLSDEVRVLCL